MNPLCLFFFLTAYDPSCSDAFLFDLEIGFPYLGGAPVLSGATPTVMTTTHGDGPYGDALGVAAASAAAFAAVTGNYGLGVVAGGLGVAAAVTSGVENGTIGFSGAPDAGAVAAGPDSPGIGPTGPEGGDPSPSAGDGGDGGDGGDWNEWEYASGAPEPATWLMMLIGMALFTLIKSLVSKRRAGHDRAPR